MSGPVQRGGVTVEYDNQGRIIHRFRQSTLGELDICPERGRLTLTGNMPRVETDAAGLGTAAHYGIEKAFEALAEHGPLDPDEIYDHMVAEFDRISDMGNFEWKKYRRSKVLKYLRSIAEVFHSDVYADIRPLGIEIPFKDLVIYEDAERVIMIEGTIDLLDAVLGAADWKTAGDARKFARGFGGEGWKMDRWAIQPTVYIQALLLLGRLDPDAAAWPFTYLVFHLGSKNQAELQKLTVERHQGDLDWLAEKCLSYAQLIEAEVAEWPKQDNSALCSEVWAPCWDLCKGRNYAEGWPKPSLPSEQKVTVNST